MAAMGGFSCAICSIILDCPSRSISKLAATQGHDASTISRRVTQLEHHGLVERLPDPSDGRACTVRLTADGHAALTEERASRTGMLRSILADWPEHDLADLDRLLTRLSADMAADAAAAGTPPSSPTAASERSTA